MAHADQFRQALEDGDLDTLRGIWAQIAPLLPQPATDEDAAVVMHRARTEADTVSLRARAYSHRWLEERGLPSGLPDALKPAAERIYPRVVEGVGISVNFRSEWMRPARKLVTKVMSDAVEDCYASKKTEPTFVRARMQEVKTAELCRLFG